uniref:Si:ch211-215k15.4 n=1 Tax=Myripristis murdjan TaxID=586833 RepID=A0A667Y222_9TELE
TVHVLALYTLLLLLFMCVNLALRGRATQSSVYPLGIPINAIDGNRDTDYGQGSCSHTQDNFSPWWRLDLLKTYKVDSVIEIRIGNSLNNNPRCAVVSHIIGGGTETFQCDGMEGRYVNLIIPGRKELLTLCEVEVYGHKNLALRGRATQSSVYPAGIAINAIDGNRASNWYQGSCSSTQDNFSPWWRVDLLKTYEVDSVSITNIDVDPQKINGVEIRIGNSLDNNGNNNPRCAVVSHIVGGGTETFQCNGMVGRYVNLVVPGRKEYLTLCEVEALTDCSY